MEVGTFFALDGVLSRQALGVEEATLCASTSIFIKVFIAFADDTSSICIEKGGGLALVTPRTSKALHAVLLAWLTYISIEVVCAFALDAKTWANGDVI